MSTSSTSASSASATSNSSQPHAPPPPTLKMQPPSQPQPNNAFPHPSQTAPARQPLHPSIIDKLDPDFVRLYNEHIANGPPPSADINVVRQNYSSLYRYATQNPSGVGGIGETVVPGWDKYPGEIGVRVYAPPGEPQGERKVWPVHFNFHGGGWAVGDLETDAHICHHICRHVPCCVIDVDYRRIPEYPFPIGIMDSLTAVAHILANHATFSIDPDSITFGGESSGATIALILNHMFRDANMADRIRGVVVGTPTISDVRKYATPDMSPWPSMQESQYAPLLNWEKLKWFDTFKWMSLGSNAGVSHKEQKRDISWFADAMNAPKFEGLAPLTWVGTAEFDPLRDEAEAYAKKCEEAGNKVIVKRFPGVPHPFMHMDRVLKQGREYVDDVITNVRTCLWPDPQKHPNNVPRDAASQYEKAPACQPVRQPSPNPVDEKTNEDEVMGDALSTTAAATAATTST